MLSNNVIDATTALVQTGDVTAIESFGRENATLSMSSLSSMLQAAVSASEKNNGNGSSNRDQIATLCDICLRTAHANNNDVYNEEVIYRIENEIRNQEENERDEGDSDGGSGETVARSTTTGSNTNAVLSMIPNEASVLFLGSSLRNAHRAKMAEMCLDSLASELED